MRFIRFFFNYCYVSGDHFVISGNHFISVTSSPAKVTIHIFNRLARNAVERHGCCDELSLRVKIMSSMDGLVGSAMKKYRDELSHTSEYEISLTQAEFEMKFCIHESKITYLNIF